MKPSMAALKDQSSIPGARAQGLGFRGLGFGIWTAPSNAVPALGLVRLFGYDSYEPPPQKYGSRHLLILNHAPLILNIHPRIHYTWVSGQASLTSGWGVCIMLVSSDENML